MHVAFGIECKIVGCSATGRYDVSQKVFTGTLALGSTLPSKVLSQDDPWLGQITEHLPILKNIDHQDFVQLFFAPSDLHQSSTLSNLDSCSSGVKDCTQSQHSVEKQLNSNISSSSALANAYKFDQNSTTNAHLSLNTAKHRKNQNSNFLSTSQEDSSADFLSERLTKDDLHKLALSKQTSDLSDQEIRALQQALWPNPEEPMFSNYSNLINFKIYKNHTQFYLRLYNAFTLGLALRTLENKSHHFELVMQIKRDHLGGSGIEGVIRNALDFLHINFVELAIQNQGEFSPLFLQTIAGDTIDIPQTLSSSQILLISALDLNPKHSELLTSLPSNGAKATNSADILTNNENFPADSQRTLTASKTHYKEAESETFDAKPTESFTNLQTSTAAQDDLFQAVTLALLENNNLLTNKSELITAQEGVCSNKIHKPNSSIRDNESDENFIQKCRAVDLIFKNADNLAHANQIADHLLNAKLSQDLTTDIPLSVDSTQSYNLAVSKPSSISIENKLETDPCCQVMDQSHSPKLKQAQNSIFFQNNQELSVLNSKLKGLTSTNLSFIEIAANLTNSKQCSIFFVSPNIATSKLKFTDLIFGLTFTASAKPNFSLLASGSILFIKQRLKFSLQGYISPKCVILNASLDEGLIRITSTLSISKLDLAIGLESGTPTFAMSTLLKTSNLAIYIGIALSEFVPTLFALSLGSSTGKCSLKTLLEEILGFKSDLLNFLDCITLADLDLHAVQGKELKLPEVITYFPSLMDEDYNSKRIEITHHVVQLFNEVVNDAFKIDPDNAELYPLGLDDQNSLSINVNNVALYPLSSAHTSASLSPNKPCLTDISSHSNESKTQGSISSNISQFVQEISSQEPTLQENIALTKVHSTDSLSRLNKQQSVPTQAVVAKNGLTAKNFILSDKVHMRNFHINEQGNISLSFQCYICLNEIILHGIKLQPGIFSCGSFILFGYKFNFLLQVNTEGKSLQCMVQCDKISIFGLLVLSDCDCKEASATQQAFSKQLKDIILATSQKNNLTTSLIDFSRPGPKGMINIDLQKPHVEFYLNAKIQLLFWGIESLVYLNDGFIFISSVIQCGVLTFTIILQALYASLSEHGFAFSIKVDTSYFKQKIEQAQNSIKKAAADVNKKFEDAKQVLQSAQDKVNGLNQQLSQFDNSIADCKYQIKHSGFFTKIAKCIKLAGLYVARAAVYAAQQIALGALKVAQLALSGIQAGTQQLFNLTQKVLSAVTSIFFINSLELNVSCFPGNYGIDASLNLTVLGKTKQLGFSMGKVADSNTLVNKIDNNTSDHIYTQSQSATNQIQGSDNQFNSLQQMVCAEVAELTSRLKSAYVTNDTQAPVSDEEKYYLPLIDWNDDYQVERFINILDGNSLHAQNLMGGKSSTDLHSSLDQTSSPGDISFSINQLDSVTTLKDLTAPILIEANQEYIDHVGSQMPFVRQNLADIASTLSNSDYIKEQQDTYCANFHQDLNELTQLVVNSCNNLTSAQIKRIQECRKVKLRAQTQINSSTSAKSSRDNQAYSSNLKHNRAYYTSTLNKANIPEWLHDCDLGYTLLEIQNYLSSHQIKPTTAHSNFNPSSSTHATTTSNTCKQTKYQQKFVENQNDTATTENKLKTPNSQLASDQITSSLNNDRLTKTHTRSQSNDKYENLKLPASNIPLSIRLFNALDKTSLYYLESSTKTQHTQPSNQTKDPMNESTTPTQSNIYESCSKTRKTPHYSCQTSLEQSQYNQSSENASSHLDTERASVSHQDLLHSSFSSSNQESHDPINAKNDMSDSENQAHNEPYDSAAFYNEACSTQDIPYMHTNFSIPQDVSTIHTSPTISELYALSKLDIEQQYASQFVNQDNLSAQVSSNIRKSFACHFKDKIEKRKEAFIESINLTDDEKFLAKQYSVANRDKLNLEALPPHIIDGLELFDLLLNSIDEYHDCV